MALVCGSSTKGKPTLIHHNFEYLKKNQYINGRISWRCQMYKRFKCKARFVTSDDQVVCEPQVEHTHSGNDAASMARKAIGEMKECISNFTSTPSSSQAAVKERLNFIHFLDKLFTVICYATRSTVRPFNSRCAPFMYTPFYSRRSNVARSFDARSYASY